jgi:hypothetical protein
MIVATFLLMFGSTLLRAVTVNTLEFAPDVVGED